jgi:hypothetical protein
MINLTAGLCAGQELIEYIEVNLNYSPLVSFNFWFIAILHLNLLLEFSEKYLKIKNSHFNLVFSTCLIFVNTFYFFTHYFPTLGFYY